MTKILLFGGSGFIGDHLIRELLTENHIVTVADIAFRNTPGGVSFIQCDIREKIEINEEFDLVINLAAVHRTPGHKSYEYYETNVLGSINILNWCKQTKITSVFFLSSISVYGPGNVEKNEDSLLSPQSDYGLSKMIAERIYLEWVSDQLHPTRRLVICRPAVIFGKGEKGNFTRLAKLLSRGVFIYPGGKNIIKASGYVKDLCRSITYTSSLDRKVTIYNFAFPSKYRIEDIVKAFGEFFKINIQFSFLHPKHYQVIERIAHLSKNVSRAGKLMESTDITPTKLKELGFDWKHDLDSALSDWFLDSNFDRAKEMKK